MQVQKVEKVVTPTSFVLLMVVAIIPHALADNINPGVFSVTTKPYGFSYGEWSAKWWTWLMQIPSSVNPINDKMGEQCARNQQGPVWFLAGSQQTVERHCTIPHGMALFIPTFTTECSYAEDARLHTEEQLRSCAINSDQGGVAQISIDGVNLKDLQNYKVQSPLFNVIFPQDNIFGARPGPTQAISDGIFIIVQPLAPGNHVIHSSSGVVLGNPTLGAQGFASDVTYHLTVK